MADRVLVLVADASVLINLNATACAEAILRALPAEVVVVDLVAEDEVTEDRRSGRRDGALLAALVAAGLIRIAGLNAAAQSIFEALVSGIDTLDDGEAATIAYAIEHAGVPVLDERRALRICAERFGQLRPVSTVDLLMAPEVEAALGRAALADAVFNALQSARMRVAPHRVGWVVGLIGAARAAGCPSLPRSARGR